MMPDLVARSAQAAPAADGMISWMTDHDPDKITDQRSGFLETFVVVLIGTLALVASTVVRSVRSLLVALAVSVVVGVMAGATAAFLRRRDPRQFGG